MTRLVAALHILGLAGEIDLCGRWVKLQGERCWVYVAEPTWRGGYLTWCDDPQERAVECYLDPTAAIQAGLRRAACQDKDERNDTNHCEPKSHGGG
jgi:hypothetical protein